MPYEFQTGVTTPPALITGQFGGLLAFDVFLRSAQSSLLSFFSYIFHHRLLMRHQGRTVSCFCLFASLVDRTPADRRSHSDALFWCKEVHVVTSNRGNRRPLMDSSASRGTPSSVMNLQWHKDSCQIKSLRIMGGKGQFKRKQHLESILKYFQAL